jgi:hypothetical protein
MICQRCIRLWAAAGEKHSFNFSNAGGKAVFIEVLEFDGV